MHNSFRRSFGLITASLWLALTTFAVAKPAPPPAHARPAPVQQRVQRQSRPQPSLRQALRTGRMQVAKSRNYNWRYQGRTNWRGHAAWRPTVFRFQVGHLRIRVLPVGYTVLFFGQGNLAGAPVARGVVQADGSIVWFAADNTTDEPIAVTDAHNGTVEVPVKDSGRVVVTSPDDNVTMVQDVALVSDAEPSTVAPSSSSSKSTGSDASDDGPPPYQ